MVPTRQDKVAIEVVLEEEVQGGWLHTVRVLGPAERSTRHKVRLSWVDHDYWCGGSKPPSRVTEAVVERLVACEPIIELPDQFDAATARRWLPGLDEDLSRIL